MLKYNYLKKLNNFMTILDNLQQIKKLDSEKMADFIADLPKQCLKAYQAAQKLDLSIIHNSKFIIQNVVICGMGGSAIGGELVKNLTSEQIKIPLIINRGWNLPASVDKESLVILVSYSGETRETLSCAEAAANKKAKIFAITGGGQLEKMAKKEKWPIFKFDYQSPPRASLAYLFMPILVILEKLNLIDLKNWQIEKSLAALDKFNQVFYPEVPTEKNIAKHLAYYIFDRLPIILAPDKLAAAARRFKTQMAENSKNFAFFETLPEIFHNSVESFLPEHLKDAVVFLILEDGGEKRTKCVVAFQKLLDKEQIQWEKIPAFGDNLFAQTLSLVILGDWLSFYLAILNQINPTQNEKIQWLKRKIS